LEIINCIDKLRPVSQGNFMQIWRYIVLNFRKLDLKPFMLICNTKPRLAAIISRVHVCLLLTWLRCCWKLN